MYDVPVTEIFTLMRVQDARDRREHNTKVQQQGGGLKGWHDRKRAQRRGHG